MTANSIRDILLNMTGQDLEPENEKWLFESEGNPVMRLCLCNILVPSFDDLLDWSSRYPNSWIIQDGKQHSVKEINVISSDKEALFLVFTDGREIPFLFLYRPNR